MSVTAALQVHNYIHREGNQAAARTAPGVGSEMKWFQSETFVLHDTWLLDLHAAMRQCPAFKEWFDCFSGYGPDSFHSMNERLKSVTKCPELREALANSGIGNLEVHQLKRLFLDHQKHQFSYLQARLRILEWRTTNPAAKKMYSEFEATLKTYQQKLVRSGHPYGGLTPIEVATMPTDLPFCTPPWLTEPVKKYARNLKELAATRKELRTMVDTFGTHKEMVGRRLTRSMSF